MSVYLYCNTTACIHRRGCRRWVELYIKTKEVLAIKEFIDDKACIDGFEDSKEVDSFGEPYQYKFLHLDRFKNSDGSEFQ